MFDTGVIHMHDSSPPARNLLAAGATRNEPESILTANFALAYQHRRQSIHAQTKKRQALFIREVPVTGYGIADLLVLSWEDSICIDSPRELEAAQPTIHAFEVKLADWRAGLAQAHRYTYYANAAILVMPKAVLHRAKAFLDLFRNTNVGLWGFNPTTNVITPVYTPRPRAAKSHDKAYVRAIKAATQTAAS